MTDGAPNGPGEQRTVAIGDYDFKWNDVPTTWKEKGHLCQYFVKGKCKTGWSYFAEKCYKLYEEAKTWDAARAVCQTDAYSDTAGDLAAVTSKAKQLFMVSLFQSSNRLWLGGKKVAGQSSWEWSDGSPWDYDNWEANQPNYYSGGDHDDYRLEIQQDYSYEWNDQRREDPRDGYICQHNPF